MAFSGWWDVDALQTLEKSTILAPSDDRATLLGLPTEKRARGSGITSLTVMVNMRVETKVPSEALIVTSG